MPSATLDLEPRRIILSIPPLYTLDVPLDASDAELVALNAQMEKDEADGSESGATAGSWETGALGLKRARDLDVDGARAEWLVADGCVVVYA